MAIKLMDEDGTVLINKSKLYNPTIPITKEAYETHGISDEMVKDAPTFAEDAKKLKKVFEGKQLIGYNIVVFDIPVLMNEFDRCGIEVELSKDIIDVMKLETLLHSRKLADVYERYTGKPIENAHDALGDVTATAIVLNHQMDLVVKKGLNEKEVFASIGLPKDSADYFGKLKYDENGDLIYNFGQKCKGKRVIDEKDYANWMLSQSFPSQVKKLLREELKKGIKKEFKK
jgi:DNA polymerase-3 subunit epsilon